MNIPLDRRTNPASWPPDLDQVAEGYQAMDERRAIKTLLEP
jgi:threonine dehydrogenase-like Zn-dependent dehydrogenase